MSDVDSIIETGTETRICTVRIRENGIKLLLTSLCDGGFINLGAPRLHRLGDELYLTISSNAGSAGSYVALAVDFFIPLTPEEVELAPPEVKDKDETPIIVSVTPVVP